MGTEVLYPQDVLSIRRLGYVPRPAAAAAFLPRRKPHHGSPNPVTNSVSNPRPHRRSEPRKKREGSPTLGPSFSVARSTNLVMGQVTILRRGQSLDSPKEKKEAGGRQQGKKKQGEAAEVVLSSLGGGDLIVFGTGRLGPDPVAVPKQIRFGDNRRKEAKAAVRSDVYAGSAFSNSPSPRALPLPKFSRREDGGGAVDLSATKDLRRLLRLD